MNCPNCGSEITKPSISAVEGKTPREKQVRELKLRGLTNRQIASALGITENTVKRFVSGILQRGKGMTAREKQVMELKAARFKAREIAAKLGLSQKTISTHILNARKHAAGI